MYRSSTQLAGELTPAIALNLDGNEMLEHVIAEARAHRAVEQNEGQEVFLIIVHGMHGAQPSKMSEEVLKELLERYRSCDSL